MQKLQFFLKKIGQPRPLFYLFLSFQTHITILHQFKEKNVMTIQYTALGFELITFETWVSSHNH